MQGSIYRLRFMVLFTYYMKYLNRFLLSIAALGLLVFLVPQSVYAASVPANPPAGSSYADRLAQRKAERDIKLDDKDAKRLGEQCTGAQGKIRTLYQSVTKTIEDRKKSYHRVDAKLWVTIGRLKLADRDTFELEKQRSNLADKINDFQTTATNYTQTLDDIQLINCKADVVGFKALLETARIYRQQVVDKSSSIHDYTANDIKKTLAGHVSEMQPKTEGNN